MLLFLLIRIWTTDYFLNIELFGHNLFWLWNERAAGAHLLCCILKRAARSKFLVIRKLTRTIFFKDKLGGTSFSTEDIPQFFYPSLPEFLNQEDHEAAVDEEALFSSYPFTPQDGGQGDSGDHQNCLGFCGRLGKHIKFLSLNCY